mgnify:CR=1 FL=1
MFCSKCGIANNDTNNFCSACGAELPNPDSVSARMVAPTAVAGPEEFYKAYIGPKNQSFYMRHFTRFDRDGKTSISWNWPSFFFTFYWFLYRKMWRNALIYFLLPNIFLFTVGLLAGMAMTATEAVGNVILVAQLVYFVVTLIVPPLFANALYYKHCKAKIAGITATSNDVQRQLGELSGKGGTSNIALFVVIFFFGIAMIGILAAIAIPAYQDYTYKAKVHQAVTAGHDAANSVADYYTKYQMIPISLVQAGYTTTLAPSVRSMVVSDRNGSIMITLTGGVIEGKTVMLTPSLDANKQITWTCKSDDIRPALLPKGCRN